MDIYSLPCSRTDKYERLGTNSPNVFVSKCSEKWLDMVVGLEVAVDEKSPQNHFFNTKSRGKKLAYNYDTAVQSGPVKV